MQMGYCCLKAASVAADYGQVGLCGVNASMDGREAKVDIQTAV